MGIFTRFKDIISSNINSMLDGAEDPEKLIRLMIGEMEETLVELKSGTASLMAEQTKTRKQRERADADVALWEHRIELAVLANRDDMAAEAAEETVHAREAAARLAEEEKGFEELIAKGREDIHVLEERIEATKERRRLLVERGRQAQKRIQARTAANKSSGIDTMRRFDLLEQRIARMESEADLRLSTPVSAPSFRDMENSEAVNKELAAARQRLAGRSAAGSAQPEETKEV